MPQPPGTTSHTQQDDESLGMPVAAAGDPADLPRDTKRKDLPVESPGRMVLPNRQSVFVTLNDISRGGCCVMRKGELALQPNDRVCIEMWREDIQTKASLSATVRWVRQDNGMTKAGLRFLDTSVKTQRLIDQYLERSFNPGA